MYDEAELSGIPLTEEDPPGAKHGTSKDKDGTHDDDDNERLPNCSIKSAQGSSCPIHPDL